MKIPRTKLVDESRSIKDAVNQRTKVREKVQDEDHKALQQPKDGTRVNVGMSKAIVDLEQEARQKVERLKTAYQEGKLEYSGQEVAEKLVEAVSEEVALERLAQQLNNTSKE